MGFKKFRFRKTLPNKSLSNYCEQIVLSASPVMKFDIYFPSEGLLQLFVNSNISFRPC